MKSVVCCMRMDRNVSKPEEQAEPPEVVEKSSDPMVGLFARETKPEDLPEPEEGKYMLLEIGGTTEVNVDRPVPVPGSDEKIQIESSMYVLVDKNGIPVNPTVKNLVKWQREEYVLKEIVGEEAEFEKAE